jgi:transposase
MNTKLHAICDSQGRPIDLFVTAGQVFVMSCSKPLWSPVTTIQS